MTEPPPTEAETSAEAEAEAEATPEPEPGPEPAPATGKRPPWALVLAGLAGLAVGTVVVGGVWLVSGTGHIVDKRPITAPARLGEYLPFDQLDLNKNPRAAMGVARSRKQVQESTRLLSEAHGGAGAVWAHYSDQDLKTQLILQVYRDRSPYPLFLPYTDADELGLAKADQTVEQFGQVSCLVKNEATPHGKTPAPDSAQVLRCARATDTLTVEISAPTGGITPPEKLAELVDGVWTQVS